MSNNGFFIISAILGLGIPAIVVISSVILFIVKIIERIKEKKNEWLRYVTQVTDWEVEEYLYRL